MTASSLLLNVTVLVLRAKLTFRLSRVRLRANVRNSVPKYWPIFFMFCMNDGAAFPLDVWAEYIVAHLILVSLLAITVFFIL